MRGRKEEGGRRRGGIRKGGGRELSEGLLERKSTRERERENARGREGGREGRRPRGRERIQDDMNQGDDASIVRLRHHFMLVLLWHHKKRSLT
jgi:hypothetical protein